MTANVISLFRIYQTLADGFFAKSNARMRRMLTAALAGLACVLVSWPATAATINWGTPANISGDTDVSASGTALYAYTGGSGGTVNGVAFSAGTGFATWGNVSFTSGFTGSSNSLFSPISAQSLSLTYSNLLVGGAYGGASAGTVTLNGLTPNEAYAVQIWVSDPRSAGVSRYETASNTVASASTALLLYNNQFTLGYAGQYVIGTFFANSTSQSFTLLPNSGGSVQLNAISVRDLGGPNKIWLGSGDTSWSTSANWSPSGAPLTGQSVVFNSSSTANLATMPDQSYTLGTIALSNAPSPVSIGASGYTLTLNGGINLFGTAQSLTINDPVALGGWETWTNNGNLTLNADISGSVGLTLAGSGVTTISYPVTYLYKTTVSGGTLALSGSGSLASSSISLAGGATLDVSAEYSPFTLGGRTLENSSSGAVINGANDCTSGTLNLAFDGTNPCFIQTNGTMTISSSTAITVNYSGGPLPAGTYTLIAAATSGNIGQVTGSLPTPVILGNGAVGAASLAIDGSGNLNLVIATPDVWTGAANNLWSNGGNWIPGNEPNPGDSILFNNLSAANLNVSQDDTGSGGVINGLTVLNPAGPVTISGPGNLSVSGGGLNLSAASQNLTIAAPLIVNANQNWLVTNSGSLTIGGPVSSVSGGNVTINGGGTLKLGAAHILDALTNNPATCDFTLSAGKLDLNGNSQAMNGLNASTNTVVDNTSASPVTLTIGGNGDGSTNNGVIQNSGGGALQLQVNRGDLKLSSTNTYTGGTVFNGGRLLFPSNGSVLGTGPVTFNPGSSALTLSVTFTNALTLNGGYLELGGGGYPNLVNQTWSGPVTAMNSFSMSGDNQGCTLTLSGPMNFGAGGLTVTNFGNNGPQEGYAVSKTGDTLSGNISGSGGINYWLSGANSRLTVQGANTYTGGTIVTGDPANPGGKLNVWGHVNAFSTGLVTLNANAIIESAPGSATVTNALTLNGGTLQSEPQYNDYNTLTWSGPITLTADSALVQYASGALNTKQSSGVTVSGSLNMNGFTLTCSSPVAAYNGNIISGSISGSGNILQNGKNSLTISGSNTFSGTFRSLAGTLKIANIYALQNATLDMNALDAGAVSVTVNAILGALTGSRDLNLGTYTVSIGNNNASTTYSGALTSSGSLIKIGSGTLTLSGANNLSGNTTVNGGTLSLSQSSFGTNSTVKIAGGAFLNLNYSGSTTIQGLVLNGVSQPAGTYGSGNSGGLITGTGVLVVSPPNCWIGNLSTSWTQAGNWALGVVPGNGSNAVFNFYSTANLATVLNADFNLNTLSVANPSGPVSIAPGGAFTLTLTNGIDMSSANQPLTITAPVVIGAPQTWIVASIATLTVNGNVSGSDLTVTGGGTVSLGGADNYGATTISSSGTTLQISGAGQLGGGNYAGAISTVNGANLKYSSSADQTLSGTISGIGNIIKDTSSTSALTIGAPTASTRNNGATTVSAGTLAVNSAGSLYSLSSYQSASVVTVNSGATLSLYAWGYGYAGGIGALDLAAGRLQVNGGTIVYTGAGEGSGVANNGRLFNIGTGGATLDAEGSGTWFIETNSTYDGSTGQVIPAGLTLTLTGAKNGQYDKLLSGAGSLAKSGAGIWTLANANTYTGGTVINGGTLLVNNTTGSGTGTGAVNINNVGTLSGTGIISGLVTNNAGGILSPGNGSIGKLTLNGNVTLLAGSASTFLVNGSTGVASNSVAVGAAITYGGVLNIATNGTFAAGQKFTLFSGTGATDTSNFASIVGSPGAGLAFSFTNGVLSVVSSALPNPVINNATVSGGNLILQGNNGAPFGTYAILTSTNLALPLSSWTTNSTGTFSASGTFSNAIPVTAQPQQFFDIKQP